MVYVLVEALTALASDGYGILYERLCRFFQCMQRTGILAICPAKR